MKKCANPACDQKEDPRWGGFCDGCAPDPVITHVIRSAAYDLGVQSCDAEIARLKAEVARLMEAADLERVNHRAMGQAWQVANNENNRLRAALAAGPAALRAKSPVDELPGVWDMIAQAVEAAQEAAMKEGT